MAIKTAEINKRENLIFLKLGEGATHSITPDHAFEIAKQLHLAQHQARNELGFSEVKIDRDAVHMRGRRVV